MSEKKPGKLRQIIDIIRGNKSEKKISLNSISEPTLSNGLDDTYLFDFKNYGSLYRRGIGFESDQDNSVAPVNEWQPSSVFFGGTDSATITVTTGSVTGSSNDRAIEGVANQPKTSGKLKVKPKHVLDELETVPDPWTMLNLDDKISMLKDKIKLITNSGSNSQYTKREINGLIERLELRKKYPEFKTFFENFKNTNDEKINKLLDKYELVMKTTDVFVPDFPDDAVKIMTAYTEKMKELCGKKPVFYVIAEEKHFKKQFERNDPILLVQSPFGYYWQILGAWDEELLILSEL